MLPSQQDLTTVTTTLAALKVPGSRLFTVLAEYDKIKDSQDRFGLCHDIAVAIVLDLHERGSSGGWMWCQGKVDGGLDHSWVEYRGLGVDMGDTHQLRVWTATANPYFTVRGPPRQRDAAQTLAWAEAVEALRAVLRGEITSIRDVRESAVIVSGSPTPVPDPHEVEFDVCHIARIGFSLPGLRGVAHGFDRPLAPDERKKVAALYPLHLLIWA
jgi:hypothetical protein